MQNQDILINYEILKKSSKLVWFSWFWAKCHRFLTFFFENFVFRLVLNADFHFEGGGRGMVSTFWTYFQNQDFWWRNVDTTNKNQKYQPKFDQIKLLSHQLQKFLYGKFYVWFANLFFFRFVGHKTPAENLGQNFPFGLHNGLARGRAGRARENLFGGLNNASFRLLNLVWNLRISEFVNLWISIQNNDFGLNFVEK